MIYADYARRKMHNVVKLGTAEGYPLVINNAEGKKLKDYTIEGNTEYGENLFNYTEPTETAKAKADENGWFDVTIDNTTASTFSDIYCTTIVNTKLKPDTEYTILCEVSERSGNGVLYAISAYSTATTGGQFTAAWDVTQNNGVAFVSRKTRASFENCNSMLRTFCRAETGQLFHIKFRIAVYETATSVGDMTENLFNYTEPLTNSIKADADGWFDVTIDNTSGTSPLYRNCYTIKNDNLKPNTTYRILVEVSERTGKINFNASSVSDFMPGQFANTTLVTSNSVSTVIKTINNFDNCNNMLRTFCWCDGGKSGHIKFRIAIYETEKGYFEPYNKYKIPIVVSGKNLIPYPYEDTTKTLNGVTFTDNGDGNITVNGTPTEYSYFMFGVIPIMPSTTFTISKNQSADAANVAFAVRELDENRVPIGTEISIPPTVVTHTFTVTDNTRYIRITLKRWGSNIECKGTFKPMLELGTLKEPQTTIYLNAPLADGESINYKADNLPYIVLNKGSNTITTDTAVKPKKISAKYYKK